MSYIQDLPYNWKLVFFTTFTYFALFPHRAPRPEKGSVSMSSVFLFSFVCFIFRFHTRKGDLVVLIVAILMPSFHGSFNIESPHELWYLTLFQIFIGYSSFMKFKYCAHLKESECFAIIIDTVLAVIKNLQTDPHLYSHLISDPDDKAI